MLCYQVPRERYEQLCMCSDNALVRHIEMHKQIGCLDVLGAMGIGDSLFNAEHWQGTTMHDGFVCCYSIVIMSLIFLVAN